MTQLHMTVDPETARRLTAQAEARGVSLSRFLAELVQQQAPTAWPPGYLESVVGSCAGHPLSEAPDLPLDEIDLG